jgi:hypothetical protein
MPGVSPARFLLGAALLALVAGLPLVAARRLRRSLLPGWWGAPAALADAVLALSLVLVTAQLLGAVGLFRHGPLVVAAALVAALATRVRPRDGERLPDPPAQVGTAVSVAVVALVAAQWATRTAASLNRGVTEFDSLHYQLPMAARFAQDGWLTRLHFTLPEFPTHFHPNTSETFHAIGMALFGRDVLSPVLNLGWLALALLAAWCAGRPRGLAPVTTVAAAVLLGTPIMAISQPGSALNDLAATAPLLAAVALLLQPRQARGAVAVAGAAAGLALGTKLSLVAPVAALTDGLVVAAGRGARRATAVAWLVPLALSGSFWYLRNLVRTGVPVAGLPGGTGPRFAIVDDFGYAVVDYATDGEVWREWFLPGLSTAFGRVWWAVLALAVAGAVTALVRPGLVRVLGGVCLVSVAAYAVTPTSALGEKGAPMLFLSNLRYLVPALAIGFLLLPLATGRAPRLLLGGLVAVLAVTWTSRHQPPWPGTHAVAAGAAVLAVVAVALAWRAPRLRPAVAGALAVAVVAGSVAAQRRYLDRRYETDSLAAFANALHGDRIAYSGFVTHYQLYGEDLSNHAQLVGRRGPQGEFERARSCDEWRALLRAGRYRWVVLQSTQYDVREQEMAWTASDPATRETRPLGDVTIYRVDPAAPRAPCA